MSGKNGKVHLLRIIFCLFVILFHIGRDLPAGQEFAAHGYIGVEFFFIVGGILMGRSLESAWRQERSGRDIGTRSGSPPCQMYLDCSNPSVTSLTMRS